MGILYAHGVNFDIFRVVDINKFLVYVGTVSPRVYQPGIEFTALVPNLGQASHQLSGRPLRHWLTFLNSRRPPPSLK